MQLFARVLFRLLGAPCRNGPSTSSARSRYPEYNNLNDNELAEALYEKAGVWQPIRLWPVLAEKMALMFGPPLVVLAFGWALAWALAGFKTEGTPEQR
jgi:hypothetical protein